MRTPIEYLPPKVQGPDWQLIYDLIDEWLNPIVYQDTPTHGWN